MGYITTCPDYGKPGHDRYCPMCEKENSVYIMPISYHTNVGMRRAEDYYHIQELEETLKTVLNFLKLGVTSIESYEGMITAALNMEGTKEIMRKIFSDEDVD